MLILVMNGNIYECGKIVAVLQKFGKSGQVLPAISGDHLDHQIREDAAISRGIVMGDYTQKSPYLAVRSGYHTELVVFQPNPEQVEKMIEKNNEVVKREAQQEKAR